MNYVVATVIQVVTAKKIFVVIVIFVAPMVMPTTMIIDPCGANSEAKVFEQKSSKLDIFVFHLIVQECASGYSLNRLTPSPSLSLFFSF